ncbi:uncharacterized protein DS421_11g333560 [Arachis hypogaea]|nr:uncharacterized protein DS421_11g333560 [Arachis hypogaea]
MTTALVMQQVRRASIVKKEEKTTSLDANPPLRKTSGRLVGKKTLNFNYTNNLVKRRLKPITVTTSSNSDDKDDTSNASDNNLDGLVVSQKNKEENESNSSSNKAVSKSSLKDNDVDALSLSGQLASQVTVGPTISLIVPSTENLMAATSDKPTPNANANKLQYFEIAPSERSKKQIPIPSIHASTPNMVNDLLAELGSLNEAYACSMDTQKAIVASCSTIQSPLPTEHLHSTPPTTKTVDKSILLPLAQQLGAVLSKPVLTLATDPNFKAQLSDILQTFSITPHHVTIEPLLARLRMLTVKREAKNRLDAALIKNEGQFAKASSMLDSSNASLQSLEEKMLSSHEAAKEARNFQTALQIEVTRLKKIFEV